MHPLLKVLDDLAYVIECAALDYSGELKSELGELCKQLDGDGQAYAIQDRPQTAIALREALDCYRADEKIRGITKLNIISRGLWAQVADRDFGALKYPLKDCSTTP